MKISKAKKVSKQRQMYNKIKARRTPQPALQPPTTKNKIYKVLIISIRV